MGFWTDKDKKEEQQGQGNTFDSNMFSSGFDSFRECRKDPSSDAYLLCKDVKQSLGKDGKWSREEGNEQRVSMDEIYSSQFGSFNPGNMFSNMFEGLRGFIQPEQLDKDISSMFSQFKTQFFNPEQYGNQERHQHDNGNNPSNVRSSFASFSSSSSRKCKADEKDNNFLICTTTTTKRTPDGQETTDVKEQRLPAQGNNGQSSSSSSSFSGEVFPGSLFSGIPFGLPFQQGFPSSQFNNNQSNNTPNQTNNNNNNLNPQQSHDNAGNYKFPEFQRKEKRGSTEIHDL